MPANSVLTINVGSSSVRFAFFTGAGDPKRQLSGAIERMGSSGTVLHYKDAQGKDGSQEITSATPAEAMRQLLDWLGQQPAFKAVGVVAHRLVHGGPKYTQPQHVTSALLQDLLTLRALDPDHLPAEIEMIQAFRERYAALAQIVCFDTAFHAHMPRVARILPIPRRYEAMGVQRYGFHGLSYTYLLDELDRLDGRSKKSGRVILAHLGNGASLAAVLDGRSIDTSMAFTPTAGLLMSTRSGDLDPGIFTYLARTTGLTPPQFDDMVNHQSGLLGVSETSSDMRDLLARAGDDVRAAEAIDLFCYAARKCVGAYAAALGGLDTLVFAGGIGEKSAPVRAGICAGLEFLGVQLNPDANAENRPIISRANSPVTVRMIPTDEEIVLARAAFTL